MKIIVLMNLVAGVLESILEVVNLVDELLSHEAIISIIMMINATLLY